jgi:hypothetical protein
VRKDAPQCFRVEPRSRRAGLDQRLELERGLAQNGIVEEEARPQFGFGEGSFALDERAARINV